jgi:hypothetical protein
MRVFVGNSHLDQFCLDSSHGIVLCLPGASIKGLVNNNSTSGLNKKIEDFNSKENTIIFHLGQVDFEFGYYYKSALNGKKLDKNAFIESIFKIFENYLLSLKSEIIVIGLNPTVIQKTNQIFIVNFKDNMCWSNNKIQETGELNDISFESLMHIYDDDMSERNDFLKKANNCLKLICEKNHIPFLDLWPCLFDEEKQTIFTRFMPSREDHHLVHSIFLRDYLLDFIDRSIRKE